MTVHHTRKLRVSSTFMLFLLSAINEPAFGGRAHCRLFYQALLLSGWLGFQ
jgi:hypothetical protein